MFEPSLKDHGELLDENSQRCKVQYTINIHQVTKLLDSSPAAETLSCPLPIISKNLLAVRDSDMDSSLCRFLTESAVWKSWKNRKVKNPKKSYFKKTPGHSIFLMAVKT